MRQKTRSFTSPCINKHFCPVAHTIDTGFFKLDGGAMFGVVPKSIWQKTNPADDNNLCTWAMRCLLVEDATG
jgi:hypothetical protein